jgi:hypothetical protein
MGKDKKLPAFQWYTGDWRKDLAVQSLSFHDRGVWREMLDLMHDSERRGVLVLNGRAMTDDQISRAIGLDNQSFKQTLDRLLTAGVASREPETGAIFNRRMVRDEEIRKIRTCAGSKGGNPNLLNQTPKQKPTPSSSPSGKQKVRKCSIELPDWLPESLWFEYEDMRKRKRAAMTDPIRYRILKRLTEFKDGGLDPLASLEISIRNSWTDVFEPKTGVVKHGTQNNKPSLADIAAEPSKNAAPSDGDTQGSKDGRGFFEFVRQSVG